MGLYSEFELSVAAIDKIDFSTSKGDEINVFETNIRYLGGFLAAYDLSGNKILLNKATQLGDMLYKAFDTPNRMPITRWKFRDAVRNLPQEAPRNTLLAEPGSMTLEFTRLSQITGDDKYYDAVQRVMDVFEDHQHRTAIPGMWPVSVNLRNQLFEYHSLFSIGGMADSMYEYLPKQHILIGGATLQYKTMYNDSLAAMKREIFYRPATKDGADILFPGQLHSQYRTLTGAQITEPQAQHLGCFAGGMVALAAKIFHSDADLEIGRKLVEGCLWGYEAMPGGIMPEIMHTLHCKNATKCEWDTTKWLRAMTSIYGTKTELQANEKLSSLGLPHGVMRVEDPRYGLR
jgi:mannosyl-oligosaccharide alpha-1,2-mannosidase